MTKKQFNEKYPDGLNVVIVAFKKSLHEIMTSDEIDKLIKMAKRRERTWLKAFKKAYLEVNADWDFPFEAYLMGIKSPMLLKDAIACMTDKFDVYRGENEPNK